MVDVVSIRGYEFRSTLAVVPYRKCSNMPSIDMTAVLAFYEKMAVAERQLGRVHDELWLQVTDN